VHLSKGSPLHVEIRKNLLDLGMSKRKQLKKKSKSGLPPGSYVFTGEQKMEHVTITLIQYNETHYSERQFKTLPDVYKAISSEPSFVSWLNIDGIHDVEIVENICNTYGIHRLTGEDIVSVGQRPKLDEFDHYLHLVMRMFQIEEGHFTFEQLTFLHCDQLLITFQEKTGDVFQSVRRRLSEGKGTIRTRSSDYLMYALLDTIIDSYFNVLEDFGERLEELEVNLLDNPSERTLSLLHAIRKEALTLRRSVYPMREVINKLEKVEEPFIRQDTKLFIRDLYDHTIQAIETIEVFRDMASGMLDLYMNSLSNRMNNVMKVLTIIATIFIPLTFIVGIYGMNFENMPELAFPWAYPAVLLLMLAIALGMMVYFKLKKWF
jgi:magnesium transporter